MKKKEIFCTDNRFSFSMSEMIFFLLFPSIFFCYLTLTVLNDYSEQKCLLEERLYETGFRNEFIFHGSREWEQRSFFFLLLPVVLSDDTTLRATQKRELHFALYVKWTGERKIMQKERWIVYFSHIYFKSEKLGETRFWRSEMFAFGSIKKLFLASQLFCK